MVAVKHEPGLMVLEFWDWVLHHTGKKRHGFFILFFK